MVNHVTVMDEQLIVTLADGCSLVVPLVGYPRLIRALPEERQNCQILGDGYAIATHLVYFLVAIGEFEFYEFLKYRRR